MKCLDAFAEAVKAAGLKQAIIAAELYLPRPEGRPRCGDVQAALADDAKRDQLALAPFDIVELDGETWKAEHYADTHNKLCTIFQNEQVKPVQMRNASSNDEVQQIYEEWVEGEGAEGLVVHSETPIVWKVKDSPHHRCRRHRLYHSRSWYPRLDVCRAPPRRTLPDVCLRFYRPDR